MQAFGLSHSNTLLARIHNEHCAWLFLHIFNAAQETFQLFLFVVQLSNFLFGQLLKGAVLFHFFQLTQATNTGLDSVKIGQHTAQPTLVHVEHTATQSLVLNSLLSLFFGTHKQNILALSSHRFHKVISLIHLVYCFLQVNNVDTVPFSEDKTRHFGVPSPGLVAEMNTGLQQLFHRNYCHFKFLLLFTPPAASKALHPPKQEEHWQCQSATVCFFIRFIL